MADVPLSTGLTHFTGRGLPTIWSCFSKTNNKPSYTSPFTPIDAAVIRDWAAQLDRWLARFNTSPGKHFPAALTAKAYGV